MLALDNRTLPVPAYTARPVKERSQTDGCVSGPPGPWPTPPGAAAPHLDIGLATRSTSSASLADRAPSVDRGLEYLPECLPGVRAVSAARLNELLAEQSRRPLASSDEAFPYLHGVTRQNPVQWAFFCESQRLEQVGPPRGQRNVLLVHADADAGDDYPGRLKGGFKVEHILAAGRPFLHANPPAGITLRNFDSQPAKIAVVSDVIVYDHRRTGTASAAAVEVAARIRAAQDWAREQWPYLPSYSTCILTSPWQEVEDQYRELVASTANGLQLPGASDLVVEERAQMNLMSSMSEIAENVYVGSTADYTQHRTEIGVHIRCEDFVEIPSIDELAELARGNGMVEFSMPSSGSVERHNDTSLAALTDACAFIFTVATGAELAVRRKNGVGSDTLRPQAQKVLITCRDGYTETSFLALAYLIYAKGLGADEAWLHLHRDLKREFYAFPEDVSSLSLAAPSLLDCSPVSPKLPKSTAKWFGRPAALGPLEGTDIVHQTVEARKLCKRDAGPVFTGSFPSRILPHLYLVNLEHANNVWMLKELGITSVLSLGEAPLYGHADKIGHIPPHRRLVHDLQDDAIDSILPELSRSLAFIDEAYRQKRTVLVHCRVGVSRSASVCIAEVGHRLGLSVPDAYIYVRARRLNVIIQPNLKFMYELLVFDQQERTRRRREQRAVLAPPLAKETAFASDDVEIEDADSFSPSGTGSGTNSPSASDPGSPTTPSLCTSSPQSTYAAFASSSLGQSTSSDPDRSIVGIQASPDKREHADDQLEPRAMEWPELAWHIARLNKLYIASASA